MIALFVAGICAGALINYSIDKITAYAFTGGAMLLLCPALLLEKQTISHIILLMMLVFVIYAAVACKRMAQGILSNITLRIEADNQKKQIIQLSERQNFHLAHTPLGLIDWDHQLKITSWNKACTDILGYTLDEAIGMHISFIMPEMINKSTTHIMQSITNGHESDANFKEISHKNGNKVYCEWFNTLLKNDAGDVIGIASLVQDKTEFLRTQEKIHQLAYFFGITSTNTRTKRASAACA